VSLVLDQEIYRAVLDSLAVGVYLVDREHRIHLWNDGAEKITGYLRQEVLGRGSCDDLLMHCDTECNLLDESARPLAEAMRDGLPRGLDGFLRHKDGQRVPVRVHAFPIRNAEGQIVGAAESFDERVLLPEAEVQPNSHAVHDHVDRNTGVLDHHSIESHLSASLLDLAEYHIAFSVLSIAVDRLDEFRESHGARAAETIVSVVAHTLSRNLHHADLVGRWSRNRFVAIIANCPGTEVAKTAEKLRRIVGLAAIPWWGDRIAPTVSIGGTTVLEDDTVQSLMSRSEEALLKILTEGGNRVNVL
jgi:diguanylate cyclase (GGDEF)-like protein/PAS domain S-box-containing protein